MPLLQLTTAQLLSLWVFFAVFIIFLELMRAYNKRKIIIVKDIAWALMAAINWPFGVLCLIVRFVELCQFVWGKIIGPKFDSFFNTVVIKQKE